MEVFQHQLLTLTGGVICFCTLVKCIRFMKYIFPHIWSALPQTFFRSLGEWAGKGNLPSSCNWVVDCYVTNQECFFLHFLMLSLQNKTQFPLRVVCSISFCFLLLTSGLWAWRFCVPGENGKIDKLVTVTHLVFRCEFSPLSYFDVCSLLQMH